MITSVGYQFTYKASQMDLHRSLVILLALISTACENKLPHACLCVLQLTPPVKMCPVWKRRGASIKPFSCRSFLGMRFPVELILQGKTPFPLQSQNTATFDSLKMLESEQNVLTWVGSNICTCWKESKHFAVRFFDIKWHLPMELWCLMGGVVWMRCACSSFHGPVCLSEVRFQ